jgi:2-polyprenyl-6-methoxyphenol hydroxylase-like FAD-dependent oxidoreductase
VNNWFQAFAFFKCNLSRYTVAVNRGTLADAIVAAAVAKHPPSPSGGVGRGGGSVEFLMGRGVHAVDFESRVAQFTKTTAVTEKEEIESAPYDLLVAADGVNSAVRGMLRDDGLLSVVGLAVQVEKPVDDPKLESAWFPTLEPPNFTA